MEYTRATAELKLIVVSVTPWRGRVCLKHTRAVFISFFVVSVLHLVKVGQASPTAREVLTEDDSSLPPRMRCTVLLPDKQVCSHWETGYSRGACDLGHSGSIKVHLARYMTCKHMTQREHEQILTQCPVRKSTRTGNDHRPREVQSQRWGA